MKKLYLLLFIVPFLFMSCTSSVGPDANSSATSQNGKLQISINKNNIPSNVSLIKIVLTKANEDSITASLNLKQDTSANILINDINPGTWEMVAKGFDNNNTVTFSGECNVEVIKNATAQLSLELNPVLTGIGSITITATWPIQNIDEFSLTDNNGLILGTSLSDYSDPNVMKENGIYKMWFSDNKSNCIKYAHSTDGVNWTIEPTAALSADNLSNLKIYSVCQPKVIKFNNSYYMYFTTKKYSVCLAISDDGNHWDVINQYSVLGYNYGDIWDLNLSDVLVANNKVIMFYTAVIDNGLNIYMASSNDGKNFTYNDVPIITASIPWEIVRVVNPSVIYENNRYKMIYVNYSLYNKLGYAESADLVTWVKSPNPVFKIANLKNNWCNQFGNLCFRNFDGQYKVYLSGNLSPIHSIGLLEKK